MTVARRLDDFYQGAMSFQFVFQWLESTTILTEIDIDTESHQTKG